MRQIHLSLNIIHLHPFTGFVNVREDKKRFDVLVNDSHMPGMDGIQLVKIIRSEMDLPFVIISSDDEQELVLKGVLQGSCDYLINPVKMEALKSCGRTSASNHLIDYNTTARQSDNDSLMRRDPIPIGSAIFLMRCILLQGQPRLDTMLFIFET
ncbi:hypothetical protein SADUNF_Sadunf14G0093400 [Salix dunnii]|uniref:Response regulatory domain-containing protein n=1 Tax=Salix dunnii TaxID=1413687 RepID=A0A835JH97_9ROSI|nr:hypothetical protein SADUNF_Sadunf14G0093400 [Salix dunnii]